MLAGLELVRVMQEPAATEPHIESDQALVLAARAGNRTAFGTLVRRYERSVRATCWAVLSDHNRAADAAQEAFLAAYRSLASLREPAAFAGWLMTIARNRAIRHARQRRRESPLPPNLLAARSTEEMDFDLLSAVAALPEQERVVVMLRYFDSHDVAAVAKILGRPVGTVTKQLSRAHDRLRRSLAKEDV